MGSSGGAAVETSVDSHGSCRRGGAPALEVRLLGPMTVRRGGVAVSLPASRKARALFAYLTLAPYPLSRSRLCDLFWDVPQDPRGELRWCLSKIRQFADDPTHPRIIAEGDTVGLDLAGCAVDALEIGRAIEDGVETMPADRLASLSGRLAAEFLDGLEVERSPGFDTWLSANRRRFRDCRIAMLQRLVQIVPGDGIFPHLDAWLELEPFDPLGHEALLRALARRRRVREGDAHLDATVRRFEAEGLDAAPIRDLWRSIRGRGGDPAPATTGEGRPNDPAAPRRASVAIMPFASSSDGPEGPGRIGDGLVHDVITRLAKLRNLFVIAQGSVFALSERRIDPQEAGRMLQADYVGLGTVQRRDNRLLVTAELVETRTARVVWAEVYDRRLDATFLILDEIGDRIVASIASEIETAERHRAILKPPSSLDAWEAHHRGLWHMYRFSRGDNEWARHYFQKAVDLDPTFSRAHAGLSFTHFQNAFQGWDERRREIDRAFAAAGQSLMADDRDPAAHWAMGRALWLRGRQQQSLAELETAVDLSPHFALGHYTLAFVHSQGGDPEAAIRFSDRSRRLSPFDPLLFGMLGARAMALLRLGRFAEAAEWAVKASTRPNAHAHILAIAAYSLALAGRLDEARAQLALIRVALPHYGVGDFLTAMKFSAQDEALFRTAARHL